MMCHLKRMSNFQNIVRFGFGILDAETIVNMAQVWVNVREASECNVLGVAQPLEGDRMGARGLVTDNDVYEIVFHSDCDITLEHVVTSVSIDHPSRGDLEIMLVSPAGTKTKLLAPRPNDTSDKGSSRRFTFQNVSENILQMVQCKNFSSSQV